MNKTNKLTPTVIWEAYLKTARTTVGGVCTSEFIFELAGAIEQLVNAESAARIADLESSLGDCSDLIKAQAVEIKNLKSLQPQSTDSRADAARLDWCERGNNSKDYGNYFEVRTGEGVGDLRARIDAAMRSEQTTGEG